MIKEHVLVVEDDALMRRVLTVTDTNPSRLDRARSAAARRSRRSRRMKSAIKSRRSASAIGSCGPAPRCIDTNLGPKSQRQATYQAMTLGRRTSRARIALTLLVSAAGSTLAASSLAAAPIKVACIGEHTTHSHAFPADNRETQPPGAQEYPAQLQTLLGSGYDVRNFGDCCATVLQGYKVAETHPYVAGTNAGDGVGYKESLTFLPDVVIIGSWGRHDWGASKAPGQVFTLQGFQDGYDDLVKRYQALSSHPKIFVSLPIPILNGQGDVPDQGVKTSDVLPAVNAIAAKYTLPIVDLYNPFLNHKELFKQPPDPNGEGEGEHVNAAGVTAIANAVYGAMQKDLMQGAGGSGGAGGMAAVAGNAGMATGGTDAGGSAGSAAAAGSGDTTAGTGGMSGGSPGAAGQPTTLPQAGATATPAAGTNGVTSTSTAGSDGGCAFRRGVGDHEPTRAAWLVGGAALLLLGARRRR